LWDTFSVFEDVVACSHALQGGHSSGKPGKVRELKSGQGTVRENRKSQGK